jgi:hypothetical protein
MGHTVWYTIIGTGRPITSIHPQATDALVAAYVPEGGGLTEVACMDDVQFEPIRTSSSGPTFDTSRRRSSSGRRLRRLLHR